MGWMSGVVVQGVVAFVLLGSLKRAGVIKCARLLAVSARSPALALHCLACCQLVQHLGATSEQPKCRAQRATLARPPAAAPPAACSSPRRPRPAVWVQGGGTGH